MHEHEYCSDDLAFANKQKDTAEARLREIYSVCSKFRKGMIDAETAIEDIRGLSRP